MKLFKKMSLLNSIKFTFTASLFFLIRNRKGFTRSRCGCQSEKSLWFNGAGVCLCTL